MLELSGKMMKKNASLVASLVIFLLISVYHEASSGSYLSSSRALVNLDWSVFFSQGAIYDLLALLLIVLLAASIPVLIVTTLLDSSKLSIKSLFIILNYWLAICSVDYYLSGFSSVAYPEALYVFSMACTSIALLMAIRANPKIGAGLVVFCLVAVSISLIESIEFPEPPVAGKKIILIGVDSLRSDIINEAAHLIPTIAGFSKENDSFSNAWTPIARTFPSWFSLLSGKTPKESNVRYNLMPESLFDKKDNVAYSLKEMGYYTAYATDMSQFTSITKSFGFTDIFAPPLTPLDYVSVFYENNPLFGFIMATPVGKYLLRYFYINKAKTRHYSSSDFLSEVDAMLNKGAMHANSLISMHLCSIHWPFKSGVAGKSYPEGIPGYYVESAIEADKQLKQILKSIKNKQVYDDALVIVFSDHGESFFSDEKYMFDSNVQNQLLASTGHGHAPFSTAEHSIFLSVKSKKGIPRENLSANVFTYDIAATIMDYASERVSLELNSGRSLFKKINRKSVLFFESGIQITSDSKGQVDLQKVAAEVGNYQAAPNGGFEIKPWLVHEINQSKSYYYANSDFELYCDPRSPKQDSFYYTNLKSPLKMELYRDLCGMFYLGR